MQVKEIMKRPLTIDSKATVKEAAQVMVKRGIGSLVVEEKGKIVGIVTERDVLKFFSASGKGDTSIEKIMSSPVKTIEATETLENAAAFMSRNKIKRLPVLEKGKLVGIVTATDIVANAENIDEPFFF